MERIRRDRGFTLVELMTVVLVIGILVAVAVPVYRAARERAETNTCVASMRTYVSAAQAFAGTTGALPTAIADLVPGYLKAEPHCPADGVYMLSSDGSLIFCNVHPWLTGDAPAQEDPNLPDGMQAWFTADYYDGSLTSGTAVNTWTDKSGHGRDAQLASRTNGTTVVGAEYVTNQMNGRSVLRFNSYNCYNIPAIRDTQGEATVFVVSQRSDGQWATKPWWATYWGANNWSDTRLIASRDPKRPYGNDYTAPGFSIFSINGPYSPTAQWFSGTSHTLTGLGIAYSTYGTALYLSPVADIAEIIIYDRQLTDAERSDVLSYLNDKYGATAVQSSGRP